MSNELTSEIFDTSDELVEVIHSTLTERNTDDVENRWKTTIASIMSTVSNVVAQFSLSKIMNRDTHRVQEYIHQIFRRTDYVLKIKNDINLQNVFLLGYFHAMDEFIINYANSEATDQVRSLEAVVRSYKHTAPILLALDEHFELSHKDLSECIGISPNALSNYINKVQTYQLFNSQYVGKNRLYTIAHPNGEEALRIVKNKERPAIESYTEFLLKLLKSLHEIGLKDELDENYVLDECKALVTKYTSSPAKCIKAITSLAKLLKSERVTVKFLIEFEQSDIIKKNIYLFTQNIKSEKLFKDVILKNIERRITYHWYFSPSDEIASIENARDYVLKQLSTDSVKKRKFSKDMLKFYPIPKDYVKDIFGNVIDAVIYDGEKGYECTDITIEKHTPYIRMPSCRVAELNEVGSKLVAECKGVS